MKKFLYSLFLIPITIFTSCDTQRVYETNEDIEEANWKKEDTVTFEFDIVDINVPYNLYYNVRYKNDYPFYNLFTRYFLYDTTGKVIKTPPLPEDMYLFDMKTGEPYGKGLGDVFDSRVSFLKDYKFSQAGKYKIQVVQYMRKEPLPGIVSLGLRVEKASETSK